MDSFDEKDVISPLKRIPEEILTTASRAWPLRVQTAGEVRNAGHRLYLPDKLIWDEAECGIRQQRVHDLGHTALDSHSPVEAKPGSIHLTIIQTQNFSVFLG